MQKNQNHFTMTEWRMMHLSALGLGDFFSDLTSEVRAFLFICNRTVRFKKFTESIPLRHFKNGILNIIPPIIGYPYWSNGSLRRALKGLERKNVIMSVQPGRGNTNQYLLNVPDLLGLAHMITQNNPLGVLAQKTSLLFKDMGWVFSGELIFRGELIMRLEESINMAFSKSAAAMERKAEKRARSENPLWIFDFVHKHCTDNKTPYFESGWSSKTKGQARWWLSKCYMEGIDPRVRLTGVCDRWPEICVFMKKFHVSLKSSVSFAEYVTYWSRINEFLDGAHDDPGIDRWWEEPKEKRTVRRYESEEI